jgi:purine-binding chemotaxis protein CheW
VVDAVSGGLELDPAQLCEPPEFASSLDTRYIQSLGSIDDRMLIVVDIERLMLSADMTLVETTMH